MPLIIRTPSPVDDGQSPATYPRAVNVLDRRRTEEQRRLRQGGLATYGPASLAALLAIMRRAPRDSAFLDIGAGIGVRPVLVAMVVGGRQVRCHAVESDAELREVAVDVVARNGAHVYVHHDIDMALRAVGPDRVHAVRIAAQDPATHLGGALQRTIDEQRPWIITNLRGMSREALGVQTRRLEQLGYSFYAISTDLPWAQCPAIDHRSFHGLGRVWLWAPQPVDAGLLAAVRGWRRAIAKCGPQTNLLVPGGQGLPPGWDAPHRVERVRSGSRWATAWRALRPARRRGDAAPPLPDGIRALASRVDGELSSVVVVGTDRLDLARAITYAYPGAAVHLLAPRPLPDLSLPPVHNLRVEVCPTLGQLHNYLARQTPPQLLLDLGGLTVTSPLRRLKQALFYLCAGGIYAVSDEDTSVTGPNETESIDSHLARVRAVPAEGDETEMARAIDSVANSDGWLIIRKRGTHLLKLPEGRATGILTDRLGGSWGHAMMVEPPTVFPSRASVVTNRPDLRDRFIPRMEVPATVLREHRDVLCRPQQVVTRDGLLTSSSFRHPWVRRLRNRGTVDVSAHFARLDSDDGEVSRLDGPCYHLGSEYPGHYGHFTTEDIARLWAWPDALRRHPDLRLLVEAGADGEPVPYQLEVLSAFGIPRSRIVAVDRPVRVDLLVCASQLYHNPYFVNPRIDETWRHIGSELRRRAGTSGPRPQRLFVTRGPGLLRACRNAAAVEELFTRHGFQIVAPEQLPVTEQAAMFANADVIAGYAGSAMFTAIYVDRPGVRIVLGAQTYTSYNEYLISSVKGDRLHYYWCPSVPTPDVSDPFAHDYAFDFDKDGADLERVLAALG